MALPFPAGVLAGPLSPKANFSVALPRRRREAATAGSLGRREAKLSSSGLSAGPGPRPGTWGGGEMEPAQGPTSLPRILPIRYDKAHGRFPAARSPHSLLI